MPSEKSSNIDHGTNNPVLTTSPPLSRQNRNENISTLLESFPFSSSLLYFFTHPLSELDPFSKQKKNKKKTTQKSILVGISAPSLGEVR
jgi:hypothetical protein